MTPQRITMITLAVADLSRSRKFYAKLGWQETEGGNDAIAFYKITGQVFADAVTAGAIVITEPKEVFWGGYSGCFADLDGHLWELAHNPFWTLDADGMIAD